MSPPALRAVVVGAAVVTTCTTPLLAARAGPVVAWVDDHLPQPLRTLLVVYEGWVATSATRRTAPSPVRTLVVDAALLGLVVAGLLAAAGPLAATLDGHGVPVGAPALRAIGAALALPLVAVLVHATRKLSRSLVARMLPEGDPRPALASVVARAVELAVLLAVGLPLAAALDLLLPVPLGGAVLATGVAISAIAVWRSVRTAGGVLRTAADQAAAALAEQTPAPAPQVAGLDIVVVDVAPAAAGRSLADLDLRAATGATVVAIQRSEGHVTLPTGREQLREGDRLALVGSADAIGRARALVATGSARSPGGTPAGAPGP
ncbi:MAG: TrkA C-terminal domain-containing protein [Myxococcota bacterium]